MGRINRSRLFALWVLAAVAVVAFGSLWPATAQKTLPEPAQETQIEVHRHFELVKKLSAERREEALAKKLNFTALSDRELLAKLSRRDTPYIYFQSWSGGTKPGGTIHYNVGIHNPDPQKRVWMLAHVFVGPANFVADVGDAVQAVDGRFPRLTKPDFAGLSLDPGASTTLNFSIKVPADVELTNYLGNTILFRAGWHSVGDYYDRSMFLFEVH